MRQEKRKIERTKKQKKEGTKEKKRKKEGKKQRKKERERKKGRKKEKKEMKGTFDLLGNGILSLSSKFFFLSYFPHLLLFPRNDPLEKYDLNPNPPPLVVSVFLAVSGRAWPSGDGGGEMGLESLEKVLTTSKHGVLRV